MRALACWLVRVGVLLLPYAFRAEYGAAIVAAFRERVRAARGLEVLAVLLRELGGLLRLAVTERVLSARGLLRGEWVREWRMTVRALRRAPGYAIAVVATLALGLGGLAALLLVARGALVAPLPYAQPDALVRIYETPKGAYDGRTTSLPNALEWSDRLRTVEHVTAVASGGSVNVMIGTAVLRARTAQVTRNAFALLGVRAHLGGTLEGDDFVAGGPARVVVSHRFWREQLGGDSTLVGGILRVDGADVRLAGVMPPGFSFPDGHTDIYRAFRYIPGQGLASANGRWARFLEVYGRVATGQTLAAATAELDRVSADLEREFGPPNQDMRAYPVALRNAMLGSHARLMQVLLLAAAVVLLVACSNVVSLTRVRLAARHRELAIRSAHGATSADIARSLLLEFVTLSVVAGMAGGYIGLLVRPVAERLVPEALPYAAPSTVAVVLCAVLLSLATAMVLFAGAMRGSARAVQLASTLVAGGARSTLTRAQQRVRALLVVTQIAAAVTLLATGAAFLRSYVSLVRTDPGFETEDVVSASVAPRGLRYADRSRVPSLYDALLERVRALPGVAGAGIIDALPFNGGGVHWTYAVIGTDVPLGQEPAAITYAIDEAYPRVMGIELLAGRLLAAGDTFPLAERVLVSATLAEREFGGVGAAIGRQVTLGALSGGNPHMTIVGVLADTRMEELSEPPPAIIYRRYSGSTMSATMTVVARTQQEPLSFGSALSAIVRELDPEVPVAEVRAMSRVLADAAARPRLSASIGSAFALLTLTLALLGVIGLLGQVVLEQTRANAIRMALGATTGSIVLRTVGLAVLLVVAGSSVGVVVTQLTAPLSAPLLPGATAMDPLVLGAAALVLGAGAITAAAIPAWRAARRDVLRVIQTV